MMGLQVHAPKSKKSDREGGAGAAKDWASKRLKFEESYPDALAGLAMHMKERSDSQVTSIMAMLKDVGFPIKSMSSVQRMVNAMEYVIVEPQSLVVREGEAADDIFVLLNGSLQILIPNIKDVVRIFPGQYFGEKSYLGGSGARGSSIQAETLCHVVKMTIKELEFVKVDLALFATQADSYTASNSSVMFVDVLSAKDLLGMDKTGASDPYITCTVGKQVGTTSVKRQTLTPEWNERLEFSTGQGNDLSVECFDWDVRGEDDPMGDFRIDLTDVGEKEEVRTTVLLLDGERVGSVTVRLRRWQPVYSQLEAAILMQKNFRGFKLRSSYALKRKAQSTIDDASTLAAAMTQSRISRMADLLKKKQADLNNQYWATTTVGSNKLDLAAAHSSKDLEAAMANDSSESDEEDFGAPTPKSDIETGRSSASDKNKLDFTQHNWREQLTANREKIGCHHRAIWYVPSCQYEQNAKSMKEKKELVAERCLLIIRRATMQYYFSSEQVERVMETVYDDHTHRENKLVGKPVGPGHVGVLCTLFSRITDVENFDFRKALGHTTYDEDGNHSVSVDEIVYLKQNPTPYVILTDRLGLANMFNPLLPDGEYALNLRVRDERQVAQMLVCLSTEPGDNMVNETYNGVPFDVGAKWLTAVPDVGWFCLEYVTPPACASLALRTSLARRLVNPGKGRWICIPRAQRMHNDDPTTTMWRTEEEDEDLVIESERDMPAPGEYVIEADGMLQPRSINIEAAERSAAADKKTRKDARKAREAKLAAMADEEREELEKQQAVASASVLGRRVAKDGAEDNPWTDYPNTKSAAAVTRQKDQDIIKAARGQLDSIGGWEFKYGDKSGSKGLGVGVAVSLTHVKSKWLRKAKSPSSSPTAADAATADPLKGMGGGAADLGDDIAALEAVIKEVDTAKVQWNKIKRAFKKSVMLRTMGLQTGKQSASKLGSVMKMLKLIENNAGSLAD